MAASDNESSPVVTLLTDPNNRYVRKNYIAKGAFKRVFRALDDQHGIEVAWNEIDTGSIGDLEKVTNEIALVQRMDHHNILQCYDSWVDDARGKIVIITELMTSGTLSEFIADHPSTCMKPHLVSKYGRQILEGLLYLHHHGIIHRDLKCSNIFINGHKGEVKIGDFGLSVASRTVATSVVGTPEFMAPDIYEENYNQSVDIWSFGMCLLQMATGRRPYMECQNVGQIFKKVTTGVLPQNTGSVEDETIREVVQACLQLDPEKRPTADALMLHPLFHVENTPPPSSPPSLGGCAQCEQRQEELSNGPPKVSSWDTLHTLSENSTGRSIPGIPASPVHPPGLREIHVMLHDSRPPSEQSVSMPPSDAEEVLRWIRAGPQCLQRSVMQLAQAQGLIGEDPALKQCSPSSCHSAPHTGDLLDDLLDTKTVCESSQSKDVSVTGPPNATDSEEIRGVNSGDDLLGAEEKVERSSGELSEVPTQDPKQKAAEAEKKILATFLGNTPDSGTSPMSALSCPDAQQQWQQQCAKEDS